MERITQCKVKAVLNNSHNEILFLKNGEKRNSNLIQLPNGTVQYGHTPESSLKRIIKKETNIDIEPLSVLGIYSNFEPSSGHHTVTAAFICLILDINHELSLQNSQSTYLWLDKYNQIPMTLDHEDTKILTHYNLWRIDRSTFWTSKL